MPNNAHMTKGERRDAARAEALSLREKQLRRDKRNRAITLGVLAAAVIALVVVVWMILQEGNKTAMEKVGTFPATATATERTGIPIGQAGAAGTSNGDAPEVGVYLDYMCPVCGQFEELNGATLDELRESGAATVVLYPVSILDRQSAGSEYSTRAASAVAWVADRAPEALADFNDQLFANQPQEGTAGLTDQQLSDLAEQAGVPGDVAGGIADGTARETFGEWVTATTEAATGNQALVNPQSGGFGTPTITIDGERWDGNWSETGALQQAVTEAAGA